MAKESLNRSSPFIFCCLLIVFIYFSISAVQTLYQSYHNKGRLQDLQQDVDQLSSRYQQLKQDAQKKQTNQFVESEARNKLNLSKANEIVVIFPETKGVLGSSSSAQPTASVKQSHLPTTVRAWQRLFWP